MEPQPSEQRPVSNLYQIICPHCGKTMDFPESEPETPVTCPSCNQAITDDYEVRYRPSRKSKPFRMIAMGILIILGLLIVLALIAAIQIFTR
jgi:uncharacterized paraquat-inducible protein A